MKLESDSKTKVNNKFNGSNKRTCRKQDGTETVRDKKSIIMPVNRVHSEKKWQKIII